MSEPLKHIAHFDLDSLLEIKGKEVLIPLNEEFLKKTDHKKKEIVVDLPEGLLEIYLG